MVYPMYPGIPAAVETSVLPPGISVAPESTMRFAKVTYHGSREGALHGNLDQLCNQHPVNHSKLPCTTLRKCGVYRNCICNDPPAYGTGRSSRLSRTLVANSKQTTVNMINIYIYIYKYCKEETTSGDFRFHSFGSFGSICESTVGSFNRRAMHKNGARYLGAEANCS